MKAVIFAAFVAIGVILAFTSSGSDAAHQQQGWKQGVERADGYLQSALTPDVNVAIKAKAHESADWLGGLKQQVADATD